MLERINSLSDVALVLIMIILLIIVIKKSDK